MIRGLALRSLSSLRLPAMLEYISKPLRKGLRDSSGYVRKTAVMSILKVSYMRVLSLIRLMSPYHVCIDF